jgi:hypothetical protein
MECAPTQTDAFVHLALAQSIRASMRRRQPSSRRRARSLRKSATSRLLMSGSMLEACDYSRENIPPQRVINLRIGVAIGGGIVAPNYGWVFVEQIVDPRPGVDPFSWTPHG